MNTTLRLRKEQVRDIVARTFPDYRGRSFEMVVTETVYLDPYGGGGTRSDYFLLDTASGCVAPYRIPLGGPFADKNAHRQVPLPANAVLIEHLRFCGKDMGIKFHVHPSQADPYWAHRIHAAKALPA